jgi:hypothetical protein
LAYSVSTGNSSTTPPGPVPFTAALSQSPGARVTAAKGSKPASYSLPLYVAGQALCDLIDMSQNDTRAGCERDAKTRRSLPRNA